MESGEKETFKKKLSVSHVCPRYSIDDNTKTTK